MKKNILVTGGAGFIGSNLVNALLSDDRVGLVRVMDNLSTGYNKNLAEFERNPRFQFMEGDIRDWNSCTEACRDMDLISHQAALGSVPRSISDPITTNAVNVSGSVNIFMAAKENGINRVIYAASSSTYGDSIDLPKIEHAIGRPQSPYAVSKYVTELYADVFSKLFGIEFIGLRYFNVFGPKQDPNSHYAAVIPLFFKAALSGLPATINGDGSYSRDFTFIENVVQANLLALFTTNSMALNQVYNIACGERTNLNDLWKQICEILGVDLKTINGPVRKTDIPHSMADISKGKELLHYRPDIKIREGLIKASDWYNKFFKSE